MIFFSYLCMIFSWLEMYLFTIYVPETHGMFKISISKVCQYKVVLQLVGQMDMLLDARGVNKSQGLGCGSLWPKAGTM